MRKLNKIEDFVGKKLGNYTILGFSHIKNRVHYWLCKCDCGNLKCIQSSQLINNPSKGCNKCKFNDRTGPNNKTWKGGKFIPGHLFGRIRYGSIKRKILFDIAVEDLEDVWISQGGKYTKVDLHLPKNGSDKSFNASLDRIDSSKGYIKGNIQWVTKEVNFMKQELSNNRFLQLCKIICENI